MTKNRFAGALCLVLAAAHAGCDGDKPGSPTAPTSGTPQAAPGPGPRVGPPVLSAVSLFGAVTEATPLGDAALAGVTVYCETCGVDGHTRTTTDADGAYRFSGDLAAGGGIWLTGDRTVIWFAKEGYQDSPEHSPIPALNGKAWRSVAIDGDTRLDVRLVKQ
jgi:hypothetical protein